MAQQSVGEVYVFVSDMPDLATLLASVSVGGQIVILDSHLDGQMGHANALASATGLAAIHLFSDGTPGALYIGSAKLETSLETSSIDSHCSALIGIGAALDDGRDVLLYGWGVASGDQGFAFVQALSVALRADVAASKDLTGAPALGGIWQLEERVGPVEAVSTWLPASYAGTLSEPMPIWPPINSTGQTITTSQMPGAGCSNTGLLYTTRDFVPTAGTEVPAVANGTVVDIREMVPDGGTVALPNAGDDANPLNDDPSLGTGRIGNLVTIRLPNQGDDTPDTYRYKQ